MAAQDYEQVTYNSPAGAMVGSSATEKVGFHGVTPSAQRASSAQTTISLTTIATADSGFMFKTSDSFNQFVALVNEIAHVLKEKGLMKGSA